MFLIVIHIDFLSGNTFEYTCSKCDGDIPPACAAPGSDSTDICADNGERYSTLCEFKNAQCQAEGSLSIVNCSKFLTSTCRCSEKSTFIKISVSMLIFT